MALQSSDKLPPTTSSSVAAISAVNHGRIKPDVKRKQLQMRQKKQQRMKKNGKKVRATSNLKSASSLKKSLDNEEEEEEEKEEEEEEGDEEDEGAEDEEGEEEEDEEGGEEEGEESEVEEDNEDAEAEEDDEVNPRISKPTTTTTTTPLIPTASAEVGQDFIDRPAGSSGADSRQEAEGKRTATSSVPGDPETNEKESENVASDRNDDTVEVNERPPSNQLDVVENKAVDEHPVTEIDDVKIDITSGSSDDDVSPSTRNQTDVGSIEKSEDEREKSDQSKNGKMGLSQGENQSQRSDLLAGFDNENESREQHGRIDPAGSHSNVINEEKLESVQPSAGSKVESFDEDERDESNEIQPGIKSATPSSSVSSNMVDADDETNDIKVDSSGKPVKGGRHESFRSDEDDSEDETNFLPTGHSASIDQNKPAANEPLHGGLITDTGLAGSGDEEDETNDILPDRLPSNVPDDASKISVSSANELDEEDEEEDTVDNEIETIVPSESFNQPDHNRFLHGQTNLNPAVFDISCGPFTALPVIPNAVVAKYGRCVC